MTLTPDSSASRLDSDIRDLLSLLQAAGVGKVTARNSQTFARGPADPQSPEGPGSPDLVARGSHRMPSVRLAELWMGSSDTVSSTTSPGRMMFRRWYLRCRLIVNTAGTVCCHAANRLVRSFRRQGSGR